MGDGGRLLGHQGGFNADGQIGGNLCHGLFDIVPQGQNIAAVPHGNGQADRLFAIDPEHRLGRVHRTASHMGDIAQRNDPAIGHEIDRKNVLFAAKGPADPHQNSFPVGLHHPGRSNGILRLQSGNQRRAVKAQTRHIFGREFHIDAFILRAQNFDFRHVRHFQQARPHIIHIILQLAKAKTVGGKAIDDAECIAELVIEARPHHTLRQGIADVADLFAHLIPDVGHFGGRSRTFQIDKNRRLPGIGVAADVIKIGNFLQLTFDPFRHLLQGVGNGGSRPLGLDHHGFNGKSRIFVAAQPEIRANSGDEYGHHGIGDQRSMPDRPVR